MNSNNYEFQNEKEIIPSAYLGMIIYLFTEVMFFSALISAYVVGKAGAMIPWPPVNQPRLPIEVTFVNTIVLLSSSITLFYVFRSNDSSRVKKLLVLTIALGAIFLFVQGFEWVRLIGFGMTTTSSLFAGFFYTIVGAHGFHVMIGVIALVFSFYRFTKNPTASNSRISVHAVGIYWFFVVFLWPFLYFLLYIY